MYGLPTADGEKIKIIERVTPEWYNLGMQLDFDGTGTTISTIERENHKDLKACCSKMFQHWLKENGLPCTWHTLIKLLRGINKNLAKEIESALMNPL